MNTRISPTIEFDDDKLARAVQPEPALRPIRARTYMLLVTVARAGPMND
jgi:hypothetical protein